MRRSRRGFTLIELLVVIAILVLLMTLLMPAILRARQFILKVMTRGLVTRVANACEQYATVFESRYPGIISNPPTDAGVTSPARLSGSQNLRLSLLGCSRDDTTLSPEYQGPVTQGLIDDYDDIDEPLPRDVFFTASKGEQVKWPHDDADYDDDIEVIVDNRLSPARPILYFRALPQYVTEDDELFQLDDNEVYYDSNEEDGWTDFLTGSRRKIGAKFLVISAGSDRKYFTDDDITNIGR